LEQQNAEQQPATSSVESNNEPQNFEGWFRYVRSFFKIARIPFFDIRYSVFDIRFFAVFRLIKLAASATSGWADT
jgi:hypothetical protein